MLRSYIIFGDIEGKLDVLRVECIKCARKGRYSVGRFIEKYDRKTNLMKWKEQLNGDLMKQVILALATSAIISGGYALTMSAAAQGATCRAEYDLCRRVRADPVRTRPNPAMIGSCEARYARAQQTGVWKSRFGGVRQCSR
jgi:hypothetical protein